MFANVLRYTNRALLKRSYVTDGASLSPQELDRLQKALLQAPEKMALALPESASGTNRKNKQRAIAVVVGWMSARTKDLEKIAPLYTNAGIPTVSVNPNFWDLCSPRLGDSLCHTALSSINSSVDSPVSVILHLFCSGANIFLPPMARDYESPKRNFMQKLEPTCVVFDSSPAKFWDLKTSFPIVKRAFHRSGLQTALSIYYAYFFYGWKRMIEQQLQEGFKSRMLNIPQLHLFSEADTFLPMALVKETIAGQKKLGRNITTHIWRDADHVQLYKTDPVKYEHHVYHLLRECELM